MHSLMINDIEHLLTYLFTIHIFSMCISNLADLGAGRTVFLLTVFLFTCAGHMSFIKYVLQIFSLSSLSFHFPNSVFKRAEVLDFNEVQFIKKFEWFVLIVS